MLSKRRLFAWSKAGFWTWSAFLMYFVLTPLSVVLFGDVYYYEIRLSIAGGSTRGFWILAVAVMGIACFFFTYLRTESRTVMWKLSNNGRLVSLPTLMIMLLFLILGAYSLLVYRTKILFSSEDVQIVAGRFVGNVTGYQTIAHVFIFVPTIFMLLYPNHWVRRVGWLTSFAYLYLSLPHAWSRFITLSMLVALSIVWTINNKKRWSNLFLILAIIIFGAALQIRGHESWTIETSASSLAEKVEKVPDRASKVFADVDTAMLASWYLESYLKDTVTGYDYGIPIINYVISGWIPGRFFPEKYFLVDWLKREQGGLYSPTVIAMLVGAKSTLLGSFYANGGLIFVILEMILMGYLFRKMDGMLDEDTPNLVKALGISWMSVLWMVWGSADYWGLMIFGAMAIPAIFLWISSPKFNRYSPKYPKMLVLNQNQ